MERSISVSSKKRTTVRPKFSPELWLRPSVRALSWVAPDRAEAWVTRLFFRPQRRRAPRPPEVAGMSARPFTVRVHTFEVRAWSFGEGRPVLLVHGWEGSPRQMTPFVEPLVKAGLRPVLFDLPAHGFSTGEELSAIDISEAVSSIEAVVGPLAGLIAHSLGGTGASVALGAGLRPDRVVLLAAGADAMYFAERVAAFVGLPEERRGGMKRRVSNRLGGVTHVPDRLVGVKVPALLFHDPEDTEVPFDHSVALARAWEGATLRPVYGLGHRDLLKEPLIVAQTCRFITHGEVPTRLNPPMVEEDDYLMLG